MQKSGNARSESQSDYVFTEKFRAKPKKALCVDRAEPLELLLTTLKPYRNITYQKLADERKRRGYWRLHYLLVEIIFYSITNVKNSCIMKCT